MKRWPKTSIFIFICGQCWSPFSSLKFNLKYIFEASSSEQSQYIWGGIQSSNHPNDGWLSNEWPHAFEPTDNVSTFLLFSGILLISTNIYTTFDGVYDQKVIKTDPTQCYCKAILVCVCIHLSVFVSHLRL